MPDVFESPIATTQVAGLRGPNRAAYDTFLPNLARRGCEAMDYRVTGNVLERLCARHLRADWRVVVAFAEPDTAWVVLVGQHTSDLGRDVYDLLYRLLGTQPEPNETRRKPPCCEHGRPPVTDDQVIDTLTRRTREVLSRRSR